jgi:hypothetical protein
MAKFHPIANTHNGDMSHMFFCPGCNEHHGIITNRGATGGPVWDFNGDLDRPTVSPSILVTWPANPDASEEFKEWRTERRCHSFIREGKIQYLSDCTHELAGQTIEIPEWG